VFVVIMVPHAVRATLMQEKYGPALMSGCTSHGTSSLAGAGERVR
jgi:hypothetical protein